MTEEVSLQRDAAEIAADARRLVRDAASLVDDASRAGRDLKRLIADNPYTALSIALGTGFVLGGGLAPAVLRTGTSVAGRTVLLLLARQLTEHFGSELAKAVMPNEQHPHQTRPTDNFDTEVNQ